MIFILYIQLFQISILKIMFQDGGTGGTGVMTGIHSFATELAQVDVQFRQTSRELAGKLVVYAVILRLLVSLETKGCLKG